MTYDQIKVVWGILILRDSPGGKAQHYCYLCTGENQEEASQHAEELFRKRYPENKEHASKIAGRYPTPSASIISYCMSFTEGELVEGSDGKKYRLRLEEMLEQ